MMDENLYVAPDGKRYRAVDSQNQDDGNCGGCSFWLDGCQDCLDIGLPCLAELRADGCNIIWVPDDALAPLTELTAEPAFPGTLRDWFAGMALSGMLSNHGFDHTDTALGYWAYRYADETMKAREARNG